MDIQSNLTNVGVPIGTVTMTGNRLGPAPWAEISADEKIERLRNELEGWRRVCAELRERVDTLEHHRHDSDGKVLITLEQADRLRRNQAASYNTLR